MAVWFASTGSWQGVFGVQAACGALGLWFALRAVPRDGSTHAWVAPWRILMRLPVLATLLAVLLHVGSFFGTLQMATKWLDQPDLVPKERQATVWIVLGLASAIGSFVFGRVSDRVGKRAFVLMTSVVLVACFVLLTRTRGMSMLAPVGTVLAITAAARTGPLQALTSGLVPEHELGTLMGLRAFFMQLGVGLFVQLAGWLQQGADFRAVLYAAAGCQCASYLAIRLFVRERR
jgi:predicted MFS family arabinose efflux permease